jgi:uncharacterized delta-60 repeat protein
VDTTFNPGFGADAPIHAIAVQPDGKLVLGGEFYYLALSNLVHIGRLNADGSLDKTFNVGSGAQGPGASSVYALALQQDGRILLGGAFSTFNGTNRSGIARLNSDGSLDGTFNPGSGVNGAVWAIAQLPNNKLIIGGSFISVNETNRNGIARLNADGSLDLSFNPGSGAGGIYPWIETMVMQNDGRLLVGGSFTSMNGTNRDHIARLNADGSLDTTFDAGTNANSDVSTMALQPDGKVLVSGAINVINYMVSNNLVRLNVDGSLNNSFNPGLGPNQAVTALAVQTDGKVLVGGDFTTINGINRRYLARLNSDGSLDAALNPWVDGDVKVLIPQPNGKLLIGGGFDAVNSSTRHSIARLVNPPLLNIQRIGQKIVLSWADSAFLLESAGDIGGPFANVAGATSPHTNAFTGSQQFFRLISP